MRRSEMYNTLRNSQSINHLLRFFVGLFKFKYATDTMSPFGVIFSSFQLVINAILPISTLLPFVMLIDYLLGIISNQMISHKLYTHAFVYLAYLAVVIVVTSLFFLLTFLILHLVARNEKIKIKQVVAMVKSSYQSILICQIFACVLTIATSYLFLIPVYFIIFPLAFIIPIVLFFDVTPWRSIVTAIKLLKGSWIFTVYTIFMSYVLLHFFYLFILQNVIHLSGGFVFWLCVKFCKFFTCIFISAITLVILHNQLLIKTSQ